MTLQLSALCCLASMLISADALLLGGKYLGVLPAFTAAAAAVVGLLIAYLEWRARKGKKKRRWPMFWMFSNTFAGMAGAALWILSLLSILNFQ